MTDILGTKIPYKYSCSKCHYNTSNKKDYRKHLITRKHLNVHKMLTNADKKSPKIPNFICDCGKIYKHRQSLSKHKKMCGDIQSSSNTVVNKDILVNMLLKNQDVMEKMIEMMPNMGVNNSHNTISHNTTNNQFNIQMFLNDHCKNAMNLTDFIQSLPITSETYDSTIENGLTKTITSMMVNGLNDLDILERPIHCTDASRKTLYVKDADKWEKDNELIYILKGIKQLSLKQRTLISKWKDANEGWKTDDNLQSRMTHLVCNSMSQIESDERETSKIIRSISKNVYLDNETKKEYV